jgi:hypothetical protein
MNGVVDSEERDFTLGLGPAANAKHQFAAGEKWKGLAEAVVDSRIDPVDFYRVSGLQALERHVGRYADPPPWLGVAPPLEEYRARGHRRLAVQTFDRTCRDCVWGCAMAVEMIIDHWKPDVRRYRTETFCYGPKSCPEYRAGPTRKVPGRNGMSWEEDDWIDEDDTAHRQD